MRYFDLPVGAVLLEEDEVIELVVSKYLGETIVKLTFLNLGTGRAYTTHFYKDESLSDANVILPEDT